MIDASKGAALYTFTIEYGLPERSGLRSVACLRVIASRRIPNSPLRECSPYKHQALTGFGNGAAHSVLNLTKPSLRPGLRRLTLLRWAGEQNGMAWTIHSWSVEGGIGAIASPHFGPIPFDATANVDRVADFQVGESVFVELAGDAPNYRVLLIRPMCQRQPEGTHWPPFDAINGRFGDAFVEEQSSHTVQFWIGDCCDHCTPNPARVRFDGVACVVGLVGDVDFSDPLFRLASPVEIQRNSLAVPSNHRTYCVVTSHGQGLDGPPIFIVAEAAQVVQPQQAS